MKYTQTQQLLTLSFLSYLGFNLASNDHRNAKAIYPLIQNGLKEWKPIAGEWDLAWGPAVYRFPFTIFDDNLMFVVKHKTQPDTYAIVIRGTNPIAITDWLFEDLMVRQLTPWPTARNPGKLKPKISHATHIGLQALQNMIATSGVPGEGEDLKGFLRSAIANKTAKNVTISITGHSLAGALAPAVALWLADTQGDQHTGNHDVWDPQNVAKLSCTAFAGPSPGDKDFAAYYDKVLGKHTERVHNHLDVVPHAWAQSTLKGLLSLYKGTASPNIFLVGVYYYFLFTTRHLNYEQIKPKTQAFPGKINTKLPTFIMQMAEQHTLGYLDEFKIADCIERDALRGILPQPKKKQKPTLVTATA